MLQLRSSFDIRHVSPSPDRSGSLLPKTSQVLLRCAPYSSAMPLVRTCEVWEKLQRRAGNSSKKNFKVMTGDTHKIVVSLIISIKPDCL